MSRHKISIRFRSLLWLGHSSTTICRLCTGLHYSEFMFRLVILHRGEPPPQSFNTLNKFSSSIDLHLVPSIILSAHTSIFVPVQEKHPNSMMLSLCHSGYVVFRCLLPSLLCLLHGLYATISFSVKRFSHWCESLQLLQSYHRCISN